mgnify:CR=1 FL=1
MVEIANAYDGDLTKQRECRQKIWTASGILSELVNEVLDMSKLESGEVKLDLQPPTLLKSSRRFARSWNIKPRNSV